jgi:hypothetical protein
MVVAFLPLLAPTRANADLSLISGDTIFGTSIELNGGTVINGEVGIGPGGTLFSGGGTGTVNGTVFLNSTAGNPSFNASVATTGITLNGSPKTSTLDMSGVTGPTGAIQTASNSYGAMTTTQASVSSSGGNLTITGTSGLNVIDVTSFTGGGLTLKGTASSTFILNFTTGTTGVMFNGGVTLENLSGGTTNTPLASNILFNLEGSGAVSLSGTLNGTFLAPKAPITLQGGNPLNGAILDGSTVTMDVGIGSGITVNGTGNLFSFAPAVAAPEPGTIGLAVSGLVAVGLVRLFRRKRSS